MTPVLVFTPLYNLPVSVGRSVISHQYNIAKVMGCHFHDQVTYHFGFHLPSRCSLLPSWLTRCDEESWHVVSCPNGEDHVAGNREQPLANSQPGTEALSPIGTESCQQLHDLGSAHLSLQLRPQP